MVVYVMNHMHILRYTCMGNPYEYRTSHMRVGSPYGYMNMGYRIHILDRYA